MAGLNRGHKYSSKKGIRTDRETGVILNEHNGKYIVRIKKKGGHVKTIAQFDKEEDANECYKLNCI